MSKKASYTRTLSVRVSVDYPQRLEQARRALGARSLGEVVRTAIDKFLAEALNVPDDPSKRR